MKTMFDRQDIIAMAREAGWPDSLVAPVIMTKLAEFADLVAAAQRPVAEPHKWVGLTDEERESILDREFRQWWSRHDAVCRAIEAKLRSKNGGQA